MIPKNKTKYCIDCKYYKSGNSIKLATTYDHFCTKEIKKSNDGGYIWCVHMRGDGWPCGPEGKLWEDNLD